eukprot:CAMPEP_0197866044 /NCGR_PEP_ID=MMETSP1438-20131217/43999_1 /TAXON_ID=1461541 /ORGANISM="Pterosperma sp., Strain CCMP1384" /LENGTH=486 /DNA_ID=CAMNT_0043484575 /DNA_START=1339 /DNA_END=2799 /DNA_ORIENTATION=-
MTILVSVMISILQTCKGWTDEDVNWKPVEIAFTVFFTLELLVRCLVQYDTIQALSLDPYFYVDLLAVVPQYFTLFLSVDSDYIELLASVKIFRIFKLARQFQGTETLYAAVEDSIDAMTVPGFFLIISTSTFGVILYYAERSGIDLEHHERHVEPQFASIPAAIWFTFVTMTTVGYGDITPASTICKIITIMSMIFGILFLSMPITTIGNNFWAAWQDRDRVTLIARIREALLKGGTTKSDVAAAFAKIDLDNSGSLNFREFVVALEMLHINMTLKKMQNLWKSIDTDHSGKIMVEEFAELVFPDMDVDMDIAEVADLADPLSYPNSVTQAQNEVTRVKQETDKSAAASVPQQGAATGSNNGVSNLNDHRSLTTSMSGHSIMLPPLGADHHPNDHGLEKISALTRSVESMFTMVKDRMDQMTEKIDRMDNQFNTLNKKVSIMADQLGQAYNTPGGSTPSVTGHNLGAPEVYKTFSPNQTGNSKNLN